jgi:hypothetical protein
MKLVTRIAMLGMFFASAAWPQAAKAPDCSNPKKNTVPCYIIEVRKVLKTYRTQIQGHINKNEAAYDQNGVIAAQGRRDVASGELSYERSRRSERLAADFAENRKAFSQWKDLLKEYGDFDWRITRELLEQEAVDGSQFLTGLASLHLEVGKIDALDKMLAALEKPDSFFEQLQFLQKFGSDTRNEFDKKVCAGLKSELAEANAAVTALKKEESALAAGSAERAAKEKERKAAEGDVANLTNRLKTKQCAA